MVHIRGREVYAQAWLARVGRISLYMLDTNIPRNEHVDRLITGHLYGGDSETRIVQEKVLGIGGVRLLRKLGIDPAVFHLNEGHSAFLTLELAREFLEENEGAGFGEAVPDGPREMRIYHAHARRGRKRRLSAKPALGLFRFEFCKRSQADQGRIFRARTGSIPPTRAKISE